jgi:hypothetical protein
MRLAEYPGLLHEWPPPGHSLASPLRVAPAHCLDSLLLALQFPRIDSRQWGISILTVFRHERYIRRLPPREEIFNTVFCEFLNKQRGKTILEIGDMDATFLG